MKQFKLLTLLMVTFMFASCDSDDGGDTPSPTPTPTPTLEVPDTYTFERDGNSTVSFGGQNTRIKMVNEILSTMMDFGNFTEKQLLDMYSHEAGANDFSDASLNETSKNIRSKVAASADYFSTDANASESIKQSFADVLSHQALAVAPNYNNSASAGVEGQVVVGSKTRYVNSKGIENNQFFAKGLIGALMADQALNNYLSTAVLDAADNRANNDNGIVAEGKNYTTMEHKWDEAYGYVYGGEVDNEANPNASALAHNSFLHKYIQKVDSNPNFTGISEEIFNAFKKGRAAIVAKNYEVRDEQIAIIKEKISTVIAVRAIHYLESGKAKIQEGTRPAAFHDLSEGLGFLYSLQFTQNPENGEPYLNTTEVLTYLQTISSNDGLWTVDPAVLGEVSEKIASKFSFSVEEAK